MVAAIGWGALAASSLVIGAAVGLARPWPRKLIGLVLGFGAGALISAVSFELFQEGIRLAGAVPVAIGLAVGASTYFAGASRVAAVGGGAALALDRVGRDLHVHAHARVGKLGRLGRHAIRHWTADINGVGALR